MHCLVVRALWIAALCACGSPAPSTIRNGTSTAPIACEPEPTLALSAKRYANLDRDHPKWGEWTPWTVLIVRRSETHTSVTMRGDRLDWVFEARGTFDCSRVDLTFATHEPMSLRFDLATRKGEITSIDDTWQLY